MSLEKYIGRTIVILYVWKRREPVHGRIAKLDGMTQMVHVQKLGQTVKVPFVEILSVTNANSE